MGAWFRVPCNNLPTYDRYLHRLFQLPGRPMTEPLAHDTCTADVKVHVIHKASTNLGTLLMRASKSFTTMYVSLETDLGHEHERLHVIRHG